MNRLIAILTSVILIVIIAYIFGLHPVKAVNKSSSNVWFDDLQKVSERDGKALTRSVAESLYDGRKNVRKMPSALKDDDSPRIVFLSVSDGETPAQVVLGTNRGIRQAVEQAISKIQATLPSEYNPVWIKLDIVRNVFPEEKAEANTPLDFERSLSGIAFKRETGLAFLPEELVANTLVNSSQNIRPRNISKYLEGKPILSETFNKLNQLDSLEIRRFTVDSYFYDGKQAVQLFRGHRIFKQTSAKELLNVAKQGGNYLRKSVRPDGSFIYSYLPKTREIPDRYNILRHAGTVYAMLELYEITRDEELFQSTQRAIDYLLQSIKPCRNGNETFACVTENGFVKLGGNALAAVALAKYIDITKDKEHLPVLIKLVKWIQTLQRKSGEFYPHKQTYPDGEPGDFISQYYPGEALLALVRMYTLQPDESYLDTAERGVQYLINVRDKDLPLFALNHDHWLLYALNELYRYRPNTLYLNHSMRIAKAIVQSQNRSPIYSDWFGSYYRPPRSTPSATRSEGLYAAYQLARDFGDPVEARQILETIQNAIGFQLQTQFRPESAMYLKNPQQILGGFHRSLTDFEIRIDYVQHNISSMIGLYRIKNEKAGKK